MLSKETGALLIPICGLYYCYYMWKKNKETTNEADISTGAKITTGIKDLSIIFFIALLVWSIFPALDMIYNDSQSINAILGRINSAVIEKEAGTYNYWFMTVFSIFKLFLWTGPVLLFFSLLSVMTKKEWKQDGIFV